MSLAASIVVRWLSRSPPFLPHAVAYAFERDSQVFSSCGVHGTYSGRGPAK